MTANGIDRYGVMGYPVSHSRSPVIHRLFAIQTGQDLQYELLQVRPDNLNTAILQFQRTGGKGLNITLPHKSEVTKLADELSDRATRAGAVNTLSFADDHIKADNTDGVGLIRDLKANLGLQLAGCNILILGAGGSTRGIVGPLLDEQPANITIANRTLDKARGLADYFSQDGSVNACRFDDVRSGLDFQLVINATSAGVKGETPPYPATAVADTTVCYDLSYGLSATPFSRWATEQNAAQSFMGWGMLVEQAAESFQIWRGVRPDTTAVLKQLAINAS